MLLARATSDTTQMQIVVINMLRNAMLVPFVAIFTFVRCVLLDAPLSLILGSAFVLSVLVVRHYESNLRVAKPEATPQDIRKACDMAMVTEFLEAKHVGPEFELAQGGANLSGGQRQRMSLARAFIKDAFIYLLDDTFSALDFKPDAAVRGAMYREMKGTSPNQLKPVRVIDTPMKERFFFLKEDFQ